MSLSDIRNSLKRISNQYEVGGCERCHGTDARFWPAMTAYSTHGLDLEFDDDPNADVFLCQRCHDEYKDYWTEMWSEYNSSRG